MKVYVQNTWIEDDDLELLKYIDTHVGERVMFDSSMLIDNENSHEDISMIFADTQIIQKLLLKRGWNCPDTYDNAYDGLYNRQIKQIKYKDSKTLEKPFFIKPYNNDKSFESIIVERDDDFRYLQESEGLLDDDDIYTSNVVKFLNEYRLFIGNNKIYGITESTKYILDRPESESEPPKEFICEINKRTLDGKYVVVDVGLLSTGEWAVVEVNPPFSLSSYDYPIDKYYQYCYDAFNSCYNSK